MGIKKTYIALIWQCLKKRLGYNIVGLHDHHLNRGWLSIGAFFQPIVFLFFPF